MTGMMGLVSMGSNGFAFSRTVSGSVSEFMSDKCFELFALVCDWTCLAPPIVILTGKNDLLLPDLSGLFWLALLLKTFPLGTGIDDDLLLHKSPRRRM